MMMMIMMVEQSLSLITLHYEENAFSVIFAFLVCRLQTTVKLINERIYSIVVCHIVAFLLYFTIWKMLTATNSVRHHYTNPVNRRKMV